jgi:hypothetical protein
MEEKMKKFYSMLAIMALVLFPALLSGQDINVTGDWEMTSQGRRGGTQTQPFTIVQDGEKITVTMEGRMGEMTGDGTCKGNEIEWTFTIENPRGEFTMVYKAKVDGDTMAGTVSMGDRGSREWTAKKK